MSRLLVLILIALAPVSSPAQQAFPVVDIYANFVGRWTGTNQYTKEGALISEPVEITITETRKHDAIRLRFTYNKGSKHADHRTQTWRFNPSAEEVLFEGSGIPDRYSSTGLARFAETGYGTFSFQGTPAIDKGTVVWRGTIRLDPNHLFRQWEQNGTETPSA